MVGWRPCRLHQAVVTILGVGCAQLAVILCGARNGPHHLGVYWNGALFRDECRVSISFSIACRCRLAAARSVLPIVLNQSQLAALLSQSATAPISNPCTFSATSTTTLGFANPCPAQPPQGLHIRALPTARATLLRVLTNSHIYGCQQPQQRFRRLEPTEETSQHRCRASVLSRGRNLVGASGRQRRL